MASMLGVETGPHWWEVGEHSHHCTSLAPHHHHIHHITKHHSLFHFYQTPQEEEIPNLEPNVRLNHFEQKGGSYKNSFKGEQILQNDISHHFNLQQNLTSFPIKTYNITVPVHLIIYLNINLYTRNKFRYIIFTWIHFSKKIWTF